MYATLEYWREAASEALDAAAIEPTDDQLDQIAEDLAISYEHVDMAHPTPPNPLFTEVDKLERELERERSKYICGECKGVGIRSTSGPVHSSVSDCFKCRGSGFIYPVARRR